VDAGDARSSDEYFELGNTMHQSGRWEEAAECFRRVIELRPDAVAAYNNLGNVLRKLEQPIEAMNCYRQGLAINPDSPDLFNNFGNILKETGRLDEALACYDRSLTLRPDDATTYNNLANTFKEAGQLDEAIECYRRAIQLRPDFAVAHSGLCYTLHFHPDHDAAEIFQEHQQWNRQHAASLPRLTLTDSRERKSSRLRIGYVSPDLREHVVGRFLLPLLANHNHNEFETFCYADVARPDAMTGHLKAHTDVWRNTCNLTDEQLAHQIRDDGIDILIDLTLHMAGSRLLAFARKPAPVQATYLGYCSTTGLETMDYRLTDSHLDPRGENEALYSERSIRLTSYWCYQPMENTPEVSALPAARNGYVTFGCLNNFAKVTAPTLNTWGDLLRSVPQSRLILHANIGVHRTRVADRFAQQGIDLSRLEFVGFLSTQQYFEHYHRIDIALDPFPYGGGTTTCDALWMGVPVISLAGATAVSRGGSSILANLGVPDWVARTREDYIRLARLLASDLRQLESLRVQSRDGMRASPLMNAPKFAADVENAYRDMWKMKLQRNMAPSGA
jgi:predicted O-linked N-acetylglucosamine transferase (SPINDLY family)